MHVYQIEVTEDKTGRKRLMAVNAAKDSATALKEYTKAHPHVLKTCSVSAKKVA